MIYLTRILLILVLIGTLAPGSLKAAEQPLTTGHYRTDNVTMRLDEKALQSHLAAHFSRVLAAQAKDGHQAKPMALKPADFTIEGKQPVQLGPNIYFAVKIALKKETGHDLDRHFPFKTVTDPTGTLLFGPILDIRDGKEAILSKAPAVTRIEFPQSVTPATFLTGAGNTDIIFISDPFCRYCRKGYAFLNENMSKIRNIRIAHNPLSPQTGSAIATWVMEYALYNNIRPADILRFSYTDLKPVSPVHDNGTRLEPEEVSLEILAQYKEFAPELFLATQGELMPFYERLISEYAPAMIAAQSALKNAGFTSSPFFIVNNTVITGLDEKALTEALGSKEASIAPAQGGMCRDGADADCNQ